MHKNYDANMGEYECIEDIEVNMKDSIMLLFLGIYKGNNEEGKKPPEKDYKYKDSIMYKGIQTADAPVRCLYDCAEKDGNPINKIFCILSKKVYDTKIHIGDIEGTSYELFLEEHVKSVNESRNAEDKVEVIPIYYDFRPDSSEKIQDPALYIYKQISEKFAELPYDKEKIPVYIDYTSGLRDVSFLMTSIIRYLQFIDVELKKIIYSNFDGQIYDIDYIYNMYELINGVSEFVSTGNAIQLKEIYKEIDGETKIGRLINAINDFSETLRLCALSRLDKTYSQLNDAIVEFEKEEETGGMYSQMFKNLLGIIKDKMPMGDYKGREYEMYPELILWCAQNGMLQQALTIYTEKMPFYYLNVWNNNKIMQIIDIDSVETSDIDSSKEAKAFYGYLYDNIFYNYSEEYKVKSEIDKIIKKNKIITTDGDKQKNNDFFIIKSGFSKDLVQLSKKSKGKGKEIVDNIIKKVNECYDSHGNLKQNANISQDDSKIPKTLKKYVNYLPNYVYGCINKSVKMDTYQKKMKAIDFMLTKDVLSGEKEMQKRIAENMKYYLAVKVLRNYINHASERTEDEIIKAFKDKYNILIETNIKAINKLLEDGLKSEFKPE